MNLRITLLAFLCLCATAILRAERVDMLKAGAKANGKASCRNVSDGKYPSEK